jgi:hypothetical protein
MDLWSSEALENWRSGALELWSSGALKLWRTGDLELWSSGALKLKSSDTLESWRSGALELWSSDMTHVCILLLINTDLYTGWSYKRYRFETRLLKYKVK